MAKFIWQNGSQVEPAKVEIEGVSYDVVDAQYEGETPLSASNLNAMQDGIYEDMVGSVLYNSADGTAGNVLLSDSASNYRFLDIITSRGGNGYGVSRVYTDYMTNYTMINSFFYSNLLRFYVSNITISGTTITRNYSRYVNFSAGGSESNPESDFRIHKVIGYK